jgi:hypothetical protein
MRNCARIFQIISLLEISLLGIFIWGTIKREIDLIYDERYLNYILLKVVI